MPERRYSFTLVDVFTRQPFGGNQLAVFTEAEGLSDAEMQAIAREMNFSESTFVLPPNDSVADAWVRIFTPAMELPFAGHPVVGTAYVLGLQRQKRDLALQIAVGTLAVTTDPGDGRAGSAWMEQPLPRFWPAESEPATLAVMLGLVVEDIASSPPPEFGSAGNDFLFVPVRSLEAARRAHGDANAMRSFFPNLRSASTYLFTTETESSEAAAHVRLFSLLLGSDVREDPATGSAAGPLGAYLVRHGLCQPGALLLEQGSEMQRPSQIEVEIETTDSAVSRVRVGGGVVRVAEGYLLV